MKKSLVSLVLALSLSACAPAYHKEYNVTKPFKIIVADETEIFEKYREYTGKENWAIRGFWHRNSKGEQVIYVPSSGFEDKNGNMIPDFQTLGHEIYHLDEVGGDYHE